jgi:hypothetical protein
MEGVGCCGDEDAQKQFAPTAIATVGTIGTIVNFGFAIALGVVWSYGWEGVHATALSAGIVGIVVGALLGVCEFFYSAAARDGPAGLLYALRISLMIGGLVTSVTTMAEGTNGEGKPGSLIAGHSMQGVGNLLLVGLVVFKMTGYQEF